MRKYNLAFNDLQYNTVVSLYICSTCKRGKWKCTHYKCPGICTIYGSGHYKTFDQQRFGFRGDCSYIAAQVCAFGQRLYLKKITNKALPSGGNTARSLVLQNKCGNKTGKFHVITENMPCGTTGTTCSKDVKILLGVRPQAQHVMQFYV